MNVLSRILACCLLLAAIPRDASSALDRTILFAGLRVGQIFHYQVSYRATTTMNTDSTVTAPMSPTAKQSNAIILLQVEVEDLREEAGEIVVRLHTQIAEADSPNPSAAPLAGNAQDANSAPKPASPGASAKIVDLALHADGQVTDVQGLDKLSPDDRAAWQEWIDRFGGAAALPQKGVKPGDKWKVDEPITNALLSGLSWDKESVYVSDAPCSAARNAPQANPSAPQPSQETCAVILTTATLKQKSNPKDATPEDYKLHDLRNSGTALGKNQVIGYFALSTGLLAYAAEDANQSMSVTVAKTDGSNQVHYTIDAESHARVQLLPAAPGSQP